MITDGSYGSRLVGRRDGLNGLATPRQGPGLEILLIEADAATAANLARLLSGYGHRVRVARDGRGAVRTAQANPPDVVLLELALPGMDGLEVVHRLREQATEKEPFLIAVTNRGTNGDRRPGAGGIDLHLVKPVDPGQLRKVLARFEQVLLPGDCVPNAVL